MTSTSKHPVRSCALFEVVATLGVMQQRWLLGMLAQAPLFTPTQMEAPNHIQWWMDALSSIILIVSYSYMTFKIDPIVQIPEYQRNKSMSAKLCMISADCELEAVTIGCLTPEISKDCCRRSPQAAIFHGVWPWMPWQITAAIRFRFRMATGYWRRDLICHPDIRFRTTEITEITEVHLDLTWILLA